jgi:hypothetical protein
MGSLTAIVGKESISQDFAILVAKCHSAAAPERLMRLSVYRIPSFLHKKLDSILFGDVVKQNNEFSPVLL